MSAGLGALRTYWEDRWWRTVSETLETVVRERHVLELALDRRRPRDHWRRVRYLVDQARAWDDAGDASLRDFVAWVQEQADERARVSESVAPEPDHDAIRVLTIHGSKGLEFPIVVLAGLNAQPAWTDRPVIWGQDGSLELRAGTKAAKTRVQTEGYEAAEQRENDHDKAERIRLLYVAMTRARDHLVLSLHRKEKPDCHARAIAEHLPKDCWVQLDLDPVRPAQDLVRRTDRPAAGVRRPRCPRRVDRRTRRRARPRVTPRLRLGHGAREARR